jgi:Ca-activated chloride channel family protein
MAAGLTLVLALSACGESASDRNTGPEGDPTATGGIGAGSPEARAYVTSFIEDDAERCFGKLELEQPELKAGQGGLGPAVRPTRVVVMIDGSGSMAGRIGGATKLELAREAALGFIDDLPEGVEASLLVFGQQGNNSEAGKARSCSGIDVLAPMSADRAPMRAAVGRVGAVGWTPLAAGLERAEAMLKASATPGEQIIYVVSDGEETCGGDPVAVARRINGGSTRAIVNIIGFDLPAREAAALTEVAEAGGGGFVNLSNEAELERFQAQVRESIRRTDNYVNSTIASTDNKVSTTIAVTDAQVCISNLSTDEYVRMTTDLTDREVRGEQVPFKDEAKALLKARHDALKARLADYRSRLTGANEAAQRRIDAAMDRAQ